MRLCVFVRGSRGPRAVLKFHLCVRRSGVLGCRNENFACERAGLSGVRSWVAVLRVVVCLSSLCVETGSPGVLSAVSEGVRGRPRP